jgi:ribosomal protein L37E
MALINCPECGRENVSDTAEACPSCGFGIKEYYVKLEMEEQKKIEEEKRQQEELAHKEREEKLKIELEKERQIKEQEDKEREKIQLEEQLLKQKKKQKRNKVLGFCVLSIVLICILAAIINVVITNNRIHALNSLAHKSIDKDFSSYIDSLNGNGIDVNGKYKLSKGVYDDKNRKMKINCYVTYTSNDISKYYTTDNNSKKSEKLYEILRDINFAKYYSQFTYKLKDGSSVVVKLHDDANSISEFIIKDKKNNKYMYTSTLSKDSITINDQTVYELSIENEDEHSDKENESLFSIEFKNTILHFYEL